MNFNDHSKLEGKHAFLGASNYHWLNYTPEKLEQVYIAMMAKERGTRLHAFAKEAIELGVRLPRGERTLNMYVNDAIGFKMTPEQILYYSNNAFGTADAISFRKDMLRIHDLKTGATPASMCQLEIYEALFCLEYKVNPRDIHSELRIYQSNQVQVENPDPAVIIAMMDQIIEFDKIIETMKIGGR